jgi:hypothetical protein
LASYLGSDLIVVVIAQTLAFSGIVVMNKVPNSPNVILYISRKRETLSDQSRNALSEGIISGLPPYTNTKK